MRLKDLLRILLIFSLFTNAINLVSYYLWDYSLSQNRLEIILYGIGVFSLQSVLIIKLIKPYRAQAPSGRIFSFGIFMKGFSMALLTWILTQVWTMYTTEAQLILPGQGKVLLYLFTFILNTIPAALLEEFVFRHLPIKYSLHKGFSSQQLVILALGIALIFSISHVSAYMMRDHIAFSDLTSPLVGAFFYGLAYFLVYAVTRNIIFVTLIHAFSNDPLYVVDSPFRETFYFYTYIFVTILWLIAKEIEKRIIWERKNKA
jgi:membrane protease YdiL (CAAX protease family)